MLYVNIIYEWYLMSYVNTLKRTVSWRKCPEKDAHGGSTLHGSEEKTGSEWSLIGHGDSVIIRMKWLSEAVSGWKHTEKQQDLTASRVEPR